MTTSGSADHEADTAATDPACPEERIRIVGIGASAGGLAALKRLLGALPAEPGAAFVVVMHLSPHHESHLAELLTPSCVMPVQQVNEPLALRPNCVYVIPPNANLSTIDTHLRLAELEERRVERAPIDHFFRTLAGTHEEDAMGLVLTGAGSDGTLGLRHIREQGGVTAAQDPDEAEYPSMPLSAIGSGMVDKVLGLDELAREIVAFARMRPQVSRERLRSEAGEEQAALQQIFRTVREQTGQNLSQYREATVSRRLYRRMQLKHAASFEAYLNLLREEPAEAAALAEDLLITVTEFFRDPEVFELLEQRVVPELFEARGDPRDRVRVWSVGCSTGEEAYSLAMLLKEAAARCQTEPHIQVFASDLHERAIRKARQGIYPEEIAAQISPERLHRFFSHEKGLYRVRPELRESVVFTAHNVLNDPPFSHMHLVVCRNLLIYLEPRTQDEVFELFHYALERDGLLLLGPSESLNRPELFAAESDHCPLFRKLDLPGQRRAPLRLSQEHTAGGGAPPGSAADARVRYGALHEQAVEEYAPPSILVDGANQVMHYSAHAGRYLRVPGGQPTNDVFRLLREPLARELDAVIEQVRHGGRPYRSPVLAVSMEGGEHQVILSVRPLDRTDMGGAVLVILDEVEQDETAAGAERLTAAAPGSPASAREIEAELERTRRRLRRVAEERDNLPSDLQASHEELCSANEELRAVVHELRASQEELQSVNEELTTINEENTRRVGELAELSADLQHLLAATRIATVFLNADLEIVRFTPQVAELFNVRHSDSGRPLTDLTNRMDYPGLAEDARRVLEQGDQVECEVADDRGRWYLVRMLPYRSRADVADGVVISLIDITRRRQAEESALAAQHYAESILETVPDPLVVLRPDFTVETVNRAFCETFKVSRDDTLGVRIYDLGNRQWDIPSLRQLLEDVLPDNETFHSYPVTHDFEGIGRRVMLLNGRRLDHVQRILLGIRDVTDAHDAEAALRRSEERFRALVNAASFAVYRMSPDWSEMRELDGHGFLKDTPESSVDWMARYILPDDQPRVQAAIEEAVRHREPFELEHRVRRADGSIGWTNSHAVPMLDEDGEIQEWFGAASDVTHRHE